MKFYLGFIILQKFISKEKKVSIFYDFNDLKGELNFDLINADNNEISYRKEIGLLIDTIEILRKKVTNILVPDDAIR